MTDVFLCYPETLLLKPMSLLTAPFSYAHLQLLCFEIEEFILPDGNLGQPHHDFSIKD